MEEIQLLEDIGLTNGESKVYLALLSLGPSATGKIMKKAEVSRSKVYEMLDGLAEIGLVSYVVKNNVKYFEAADPSNIIEHIKDKKKELSAKQNHLEQVLPKLYKLQKSIHTPQTATVYEGKEGIKSIFMEILSEMKQNETYYAISVSSEIYYDPAFLQFIMQHHARRAKKGVKVKLLASKPLKKSFTKTIAKTKLSQIRYLEQEIPTATMIYADNVATFVWAKNPTGVVIRSPEIAKRYKKFFLNMWKSSSA